MPSRPSKLSIRLPFGRKKKQQQQQQQQQNQEVHQTAALQPQLLALQEQPELRTVPPSGNEDVQPVKQLIELGFTRTQAVGALERNGYDFQKALDALVDSQ